MATTYKPRIDQAGDYVLVTCDTCGWQCGTIFTHDAYVAEIQHNREDHPPLSELGSALIHAIALQEAQKAGAQESDPVRRSKMRRVRCGCNRCAVNGEPLCWWVPLERCAQCGATPDELCMINQCEGSRAQ